MKNIFLLLIVFIVSGAGAFSQGCVAIRNVASGSPDQLFKNIKPGDRLILNVTNRYFEASDSYKGSKFITDTLVTNRIYTLNLNFLVMLDHGWSIGINLPLSANSRTNGADHKGPGTLPKYTTRAFGIGDIRITIYKWLLDPLMHTRGNIQAGLGIEFPTGDYSYEDYFFRNDSTKVLAPVDQAIQPGDGGTGISAELSAYYGLSKTLNIFLQGFYLSNPREQNGVSNLKGRLPNATQTRNSTTVMSVPDLFSIRAGGSLQIKKFNFSPALRYEEVPEHDLIGGNKGFRRAASISSVEAGISYNMKTSFVFINGGFPFKRNIVQNEQNDMTPAGFANFVLYFGAQFKL